MNTILFKFIGKGTYVEYWIRIEKFCERGVGYNGWTFGFYRGKKGDAK